MAYDAALAARVRAALGPRDGLAEREMFGGIAWMIGGNMACGVLGEDLVVRLAPEEVEAALAEAGTRPFEPSGRRMRGFVVVGPEATGDPAELGSWVDAGAGQAASLPEK